MKKKFLLLLFLAMQISLIFYGHNIKFLNKGTMYVGTTASGSQPALHIYGSLAVDSVSAISLPGQIGLTGNFISNVSAGNVFTDGNNGTVNFTGNSVQYIEGSSGKNVGYINFPNISVTNITPVLNEQKDTAAVIILPHMAVSAKSIYLNQGRLILESDTLDATSSQTAHLLIQNSVYTNSAPANKHEKGLVQVNLAAGNHYMSGKLIGFTPPFKKIYSDYFFYNFLSRPTNKGLFGDSNTLITNPQKAMTGGLGYIVGLGIIDANDPYYVTQWDSTRTGVNISDRITGKLSFSRAFAPDSFTQFVNNDAAITDQFSGEEIYTQDVEVQLEQGWNYLGNPFTAPLDMATFLDENRLLYGNDWGIIRGDQQTDDVQTKYYVLSQGQGKYDPMNLRFPFTFSVSYLVAQKTGSTVTLEQGLTSTFIAPMQLFVVKKNTQGSLLMKIPASQRKHGNVNYLRKSPAVENELLIETKDDASGGYDRLCIVFRENTQKTDSEKYNALKIFNNSGGVNQIYTLSENSSAMTTNVLPFTTKSIRVYLNPASAKQDIILRAYRLASLADVKTVILEDTQTGIKTNLLATPEYRFTSYPGDRNARFILHFSDAANSLENVRNTEIGIFYHNKTLNITGLSSEDSGCDVSVLDIQGRLLLWHKIEMVPDTNIPALLESGAYIVKLTGNGRSLIKKIQAY
ncbi:T9SS type A sorting domain-containing protein [Viscerimonas tarda]